MSYQGFKNDSAMKNGPGGMNGSGIPGRYGAYGQGESEKPHVRFSGVQDESAHRHTNFGGTGSNDGSYGRSGLPELPYNAASSMMKGVLGETMQKSAGIKYNPTHSMDPSGILSANKAVGKVAGYHSTSQKFTGTMHPDSTIFKNMPHGQSSLASQGILRKDPSRLHKESLGMNPNVRVEDEYIDNLMKQIHFMNLEINLLKQKQDENRDGMGIRGLLQGDKNGYVEHIIETNSKFMQLLKELAKLKIDLEDKIFWCREKEERLIALRNHFRDIHEKTDTEFREIDTRLRGLLKDLRDKLHIDKELRMDLEAQLEKLLKAVEEARQKNDELTKYISEKKLMDDIQRDVDDDEERILKEQITNKSMIVDACKETRDTLKRDLENDSKLKTLKEKQADLEEQLKKKQVLADEAEYKVKEIEARKDLAIKMKDKEAEERKNLQEEYEILKDKLDEETRKNNERIEKKLRESSFEELGKRDVVLRKIQEELNVLRVQYDKIHKEYKNLRLEEFRKTKYLNKLKGDNDENQKEVDALEGQKTELQNIVDELKVKVEDQTDKLKELKMQEENAKRIAYQLKSEYDELEARVNFISQNLDIDALFKNINLDDLNRVIDSNKQVSSVLSELMSKWRGMNDFGHGKMEGGGPE